MRQVLNVSSVKVPRDLSCNMHKSIEQKVDRDPLGREGPNEMKSNEREEGSSWYSRLSQV